MHSIRRRNSGNSVDGTRTVQRSLPDVIERNFHALKNRQLPNIAFELRLVDPVSQNELINCVLKRVNDPVFFNACGLVDLSLLDAVGFFR